MLKKKALILPALCAAVLPVFTLPADAKLEADPQFGDVVVLHSNPYPAGSGGDPLCTFINGLRSEKGSVSLKINDKLNEQAQKRAEQLSDGSGRADSGTLNAADASETVIRGSADINTMISSLLLSEKQTKNLLYTGYSQFGYAANEDQTVWVLLLTS